MLAAAIIVLTISIIRMGPMRTSVDIEDAQVRALDELSKKDRRSRAALIREAINDYLAKRRGKRGGDAFGLWGKRKIDGLAYQEKVRGEW
jgi:predicted transcriptional regulator